MGLEDLPILLLQSKIVLDGLLYLGFTIALLLAVGGNYISVLSEALGSRVRVAEYGKFARLGVEVGLRSSVLTLVFLVLAIASASVQPTAFSLFFYLETFAPPLVLTMGLMLVQTAFVGAYRALWPERHEDRSSHLFLGMMAAAFGAGAVLSFNLINSYMIAPALPEGLRVVLETQRIDWGQRLSLMINQTWLPLALKWNLVGLVLAGLLLSGTAALNLRGARLQDRANEESFYMTWGFKLALLFGAPIAVVGYWVAALMHVSTPTIALGLMGDTRVGLSGALVSTVSPLWHIGIIAIVAVAAFAIAFYYVQARNSTKLRWSRRIVLQDLAKLAAMLWILGLVATSAAGVLYQKQAIWTVYLLILGFFQLQSLWLYSKGRLKLKVSVVLFAVACIGLLLIIGPYNKWFLAERYGGVPWPPVSFAAFVPLGYVLCVKDNARRHLIPLISMALITLALFVKLVDTALIKGPTIVPIDPTVEHIVKLWATREGLDLAPVYQQYPFVTSSDIIYIIILAHLLFAVVLYLAVRLARYGHDSARPQHRRRDWFSLPKTHESSA